MKHIHIDGRNPENKLYNIAITEFGFWNHNFSGHPQGYQHFEPTRHLTKKIAGNGSIEEFRTTWDALERIAVETEFVGYLEGESVIYDRKIEEKTYNDNVPFPFQIKRRRLFPTEKFREDEIHVVCDKEASDSRLIKKLLEAGLYGAYLPKEEYTAVVLTIQGNRREIHPIRSALESYLRKAGGIVHGTLKEEVVLRHRLFGIDSIELPEIVEEVTYEKSSTSISTA